ncbi:MULTISPECIES: DUF7660 family protein [Cupriavidus]|uniref:DUF7660 domain-containing protein n=1 Tax=Cupriavidus pinatubonensis (strain JMP 134 / LMG 1197) TaxID=264198 RepID=Q46X51_CUPPJ|nr:MULTISPECIES: hypothetical protein [Cupriavidus]QYY31135.1 hypothetical protein K2O51_27960 [Cupriavidus pinatubonensis]TPQ31600.1 hypothetical protein C2U69_28225 [Cupriavidus pinatubonensis]
MNLQDQIGEIDSKERLADLVAALLDDLVRNPQEWENVSLEGFLAAMEAWIRDMDGYYKNAGQPIPDMPTWRTLADILLAARVYE